MSDGGKKKKKIKLRLGGTPSGSRAGSPELRAGGTGSRAGSPQASGKIAPFSRLSLLRFHYVALCKGSQKYSAHIMSLIKMGGFYNVTSTSKHYGIDLSPNHNIESRLMQNI
jgi:hypothetical protein